MDMAKPINTARIENVAKYKKYICAVYIMFLNLFSLHHLKLTFDSICIHSKKMRFNFQISSSLCLNFFSPTCPKAKFRKVFYLFKEILS